MTDYARNETLGGVVLKENIQRRGGVMRPDALVKPDKGPFITAEFVARCRLALLKSDKLMQTLRRLHMPSKKKKKNVWQNLQHNVG